MGREFAWPWRDADAPHESFLLRLKLEQRGGIPGPGDERPGLGATKRAQAFDRHRKSRLPDFFEDRMDVPRGRIIDIADEAQRQMIVFGVDPARARESAAQHGKVHCEIGRDFETRKETGHGSLLSVRGSSEPSRLKPKQL